MGNGTCFLTKFSGNGDFLWVDAWGGVTNMGTDGAFCYDVACGGDGEPCVSGTFGGNVDFDPGPGKYILKSLQYSDDYACKFHADGSFSWAYTWGDNWGGSRCYIAADKNGDSYVTGSFSGYTIDFDPGLDTDWHTAPPGEWDSFLTKLLPDGSW